MIVVKPCKDFGVNSSTMHIHAKILKSLKSLLKILLIAQSAHSTCRYTPRIITAKIRPMSVIANGLDVTFMRLKTEHYSTLSIHFPKHQLLSRV